jgi:hypothetical protein
MSIEECLIREFKGIINTGDLKGFKVAWAEYKYDTEYERDVAWDYIFQKIYLHAALKKQKIICDWLDIQFKEFNEIIQIAIKHTFPYARYLLNK